MKKKLIILVLALTLVLTMGLTACGNNNPDPVKYTVTFMNGSAVFDTKQVESGATVSKPSTDPTKANYTFNGWFEALSSDGTSSGTAFDFATAITKNLTLHAAYTEDAFISVAVFNGNKYDYSIQKLYPGSEFNADDNDSVDYIWFTYDLEECEFDLPEKYAFRDISSLADPDDSQRVEFFGGYSCYFYSDPDTGMHYYYEPHDNGFSWTSMYDPENESQISYQKIGNISLIFYSINYDEYLIYDNGGSRTSYKVKGEIKLGNCFTVQDDMFFIYSNDFIFTDNEYIAIETYDENYNFIDFKYVKAEEEFEVPNPYGAGATAEYIVQSYSSVDISSIIFLDYSDIMTVEEMYENYSDKLNGTQFTAGSIEYYIYTTNGKISKVYCYSDNGTRYNTYEIRYENDKIVYVELNVYDHSSQLRSDYVFQVDGDGKLSAAYLIEEITFTGKIPQNIFDICKALNINTIEIRVEKV